jgi:hypothetical protein
MLSQFGKSAAAILLAATLASPVVSARPQPQRDEPHPFVQESLAKIQSARHDLKDYADRDFGGHRAKAVAHLDEAIKEMQEALKYDKH